MKKCAKWCGRGCTKEEFEKATKDAKSLANLLGRGWTPRVWENLGWHYAVNSPCGRIKVHGGQGDYIAFLGAAGFAGGNWAEHARTPKEAVKKVIRVGKAACAEIGAILVGL